MAKVTRKSSASKDTSYLCCLACACFVHASTCAARALSNAANATERRSHYQRGCDVDGCLRSICRTRRQWWPWAMGHGPLLCDGRALQDGRDALEECLLTHCDASETTYYKLENICPFLHERAFDAQRPENLRGFFFRFENA